MKLHNLALSASELYALIHTPEVPHRVAQAALELINALIDAPIPVTPRSVLEPISSRFGFEGCNPQCIEGAVLGPADGTGSESVGPEGSEPVHACTHCERWATNLDAAARLSGILAMLLADDGQVVSCGHGWTFDNELDWPAWVHVGSANPFGPVSPTG